MFTSRPWCGDNSAWIALVSGDDSDVDGDNASICEGGCIDDDDEEPGPEVEVSWVYPLSL